MKNILSYLKKIYPITTTLASNLKIIIVAGVFIAAFIIVFRPFGLANIKTNHSFYLLSGYGFITSFILFLNLIVIKFSFKKIFDEAKWNVLKNILWLLWIIFTIGLANFIYTSIIFSFPFEISGIISFQVYTIIIGAIPVTIITLVLQNNYLKRNTKDANLISENIEKQEKLVNDNKNIELFAENNKEYIKLEVQNLLFIESVGNYVEINYLEDNKTKKKLLRSSLKRIGKTVSNYPNLFKSHRAFILNTNNILDVKGNAQGYQISLKNIDKKVPVSRNYIKDFKNIWNIHEKPQILS